MSLPTPPGVYSAQEEALNRAQMARMDGMNRKKGQDVEIAGKEMLILTDAVTGERGTITVVSGVVTWTAL